MPYLANIDGIIWLVIIVVSIIGQIIKAGKKAAANAPKTASPRSTTPERRAMRPSKQHSTAQPRKTNRDRSEELRQFFEALGAPVQELAPVPQPQPRKKTKINKTPPPPIPVVTQKIKPHRDMEEVKLETLHARKSSYARELKTFLQNNHTQQQAILVRELLGPPLALR